MRGKFRDRVPSAGDKEDPALLDIVPWPVVDATSDPAFHYALKDGEGAPPDQLTDDFVPRDSLGAFLPEVGGTRPAAPSKTEPGVPIADVAAAARSIGSPRGSRPPKFRWWAALVFAGTAAIVAGAVVKLVERGVRPPQAPSRVVAPSIPVAPPARSPSPPQAPPVARSEETPTVRSRETPIAKSHDTPIAKSHDTPIAKSQQAPVAKSEAARVGKAAAPSRPASRAADSSTSAAARTEPTRAPSSPEPVPSSTTFPTMGTTPIVPPSVSTPAARPAPVEAESATPAARVDHRAAIQHVLDVYKQSYDRLDAVSVSEVWRGLDTRALARAFTALSSQDLSFDHCDVTIAGTRARALCTGALRYVRRVGDPTERVRRLLWTFDLERNADRWVIANVTAQ